MRMPQVAPLRCAMTIASLIALAPLAAVAQPAGGSADASEPACDVFSSPHGCTDASAKPAAARARTKPATASPTLATRAGAPTTATPTTATTLVAVAEGSATGSAAPAPTPAPAPTSAPPAAVPAPGTGGTPGASGTPDPTAAPSAGTGGELNANPYAGSGAPSAGASSAADLRKTCAAAMNADPKFAEDIVKTINEQTLAQHQAAANAIAKNEKHVILAYGAFWALAAGFVVFLWRRQQGLQAEIQQLKRDLEAAKQ